MRVLLVTPPMLQINTPYPATAYLTNFLRQMGHQVSQADLSLELALKVFSGSGLDQIRQRLHAGQSDSIDFFIASFAEYRSAIDPVIRFLQGKDDSLAPRIAAQRFLPEGPRFLPLGNHPEILDQFGGLGVRDKARYLASLFLDDVADVVRDGVDSLFELSRYGERVASGQTSFAPIRAALSEESLLIEWLDELAEERIREFGPDVVGITCPFPGNLLGALRIGKLIKEKFPQLKAVLGGGFVNTELRDLTDPGIFDFVDFITLDDGERPLELILAALDRKEKNPRLLRTYVRREGKVACISNSDSKDVPFKENLGPTYDGLPLEEYVSMMELPNVMHRLWSDFRWIKLILAHGCYWKKCTFCDISLDYIGRFEPARVERLVEQIKRLVHETGVRGFHFVDEAAPPALLKALSEKLIEEKIQISWWGNIRFDKQFTPAVTELMADAGCVAVSGGLEVASPRLLHLINKGVDLEQVAKVTKSFSKAGIFVHAYLMYGFPTQTMQETVDSLEVVRQLFAQRCIQSAFWHRFVATAHSPVGMAPEKFDITLTKEKSPPEKRFSRNVVEFIDDTPCDHHALGVGLRKAVYNFMHGKGLDSDVRAWFDVRVPKTKVKRNFLKRVVAP